MIRAAAKAKEIEAVVNSQEAVDLVATIPQFTEGWYLLLHLIERRIEEDIHPDDQERLRKDLRDWWKQGNFRVWGEDEKEELFGVGKWEFGDPDFWYE